MRSRHLIRVAALAAVCLGGTAFASLPWADASSASHTPRAQPGTRCVRFDGDDQIRCLGPGPRDKRGDQGAAGLRGASGVVGTLGITGALGGGGQQGPQGAQGARGPHGPTGVTGPTGLTGATGRLGPTGPTGPQGPNGPPGTFYQDQSNPSNDGSDPGGSTITQYGTPLPPVTFNSTGNTGRELPPAVARCPLSGPDQEAYDGGAVITTSNPNITGPTDDVVLLEAGFPGTYVGQTEVDPVPSNAREAGNAYQAQAVVGNIAQSGDQVTVQAYVVCGP